MIRFLLVNKREKFAVDFKRLKWTIGMSITEYEEQFTRLFRYAHHLVSTETMRVRRFVQSLVDPLFSNLLPLIGRMSYAKIVDAAYDLEFGREEQRVAKESGKKQKMRGSSFVGSNFGGV